MKNIVIMFLLVGILSLGCTEVLGEQGMMPSDYNYNDGSYGKYDAAEESAVPGMMGSDVTRSSETAYDDGTQYITKEGSITLKVEEGTLQAKYAAVMDMLETEGAQISDVSYDEYGTSMRYVITAKVRPSRFDGINEQLKQIGEVKDISVNLEDVTEQYTDLDTRITNKEIELGRLYDLYNKSETIENLLAVEEHITRVETDLEILKGQKERLEGKIQLSTIDIAIYEDKPSTNQLFLSLESIGNAFFGAIGAAIFLIVIGAGFLVPIAIVIWVLWKIYKKLRGNGKKATPGVQNESEKRVQAKK